MPGKQDNKIKLEHSNLNQLNTVPQNERDIPQEHRLLDHLHPVEASNPSQNAPQQNRCSICHKWYFTNQENTAMIFAKFIDGTSVFDIPEVRAAVQRIVDLRLPKYEALLPILNGSDIFQFNFTTCYTCIKNLALQQFSIPSTIQQNHS